MEIFLLVKILTNLNNIKLALHRLEEEEKIII